LGTERGRSLITQVPGLQAVRLLDPASELDRQVVGALADHYGGGSHSAALAEAYRDAGRSVAERARERAASLEAEAAAGGLSPSQLDAAARELNAYAFVFSGETADHARSVRILADDARARMIADSAEAIAAGLAGERRPDADAVEAPAEPAPAHAAS